MSLSEDRSERLVLVKFESSFVWWTKFGNFGCTCTCFMCTRVYTKFHSSIGLLAEMVKVTRKRTLEDQLFKVCGQKDLSVKNEPGQYEFGHFGLFESFGRLWFGWSHFACK